MRHDTAIQTHEFSAVASNPETAGRTPQTVGAANGVRSATLSPPATLPETQAGQLTGRSSPPDERPVTFSVGPGWARDQVAELQRCISAGLTSGETALRMGKSRNAVIGKAHRLGLHFFGGGLQIVQVNTRIAERRIKDSLERSERREAILRLNAEGKSRADIAAEVGTTPTAVKWVILRARWGGDTRAQTTPRKRLVRPELDINCGQPVTFMDAINGKLCRWFRPGEKGAFGLVCGCKPFMGQSYCRDHKIIACTPARREDLARLMDKAERSASL